MTPSEARLQRRTFDSFEAAGSSPFMYALFESFSRLALESQEVIWLRALKMAGGGPGAEAEARLMVTEKLDAAGQAAIALMSGKSPESVVAGYRRRVRANSRRLSKS